MKMMTESEFVTVVLQEAEQQGYEIEDSRNGRQIDFGHKKLHEGHLRTLYPEILEEDAHVPTLVDAVAPGRPCSHRPMREILARIKGRC